MAGSTLRICVLNVHSWLDQEHVERVDDVIELLGGIACDIIMLHEVPALDATLQRVVGALDMNAAYAPAQFAGNALLTRAPIDNVAGVPLPAARAETRSAVVVDVELALGTAAAAPFTLACLHLDHKREVARLEQLALVQSEIERRTAASPGRSVVVAGDFNALRLADYAPERLHAIRAHRASGGWETPSGTVVGRMDAWGYVDGARLSDAGSLLEYVKRLSTRTIRPDLSATCWAGTRIDYVWLSAGLAQRAKRVDAVVADVDVSDHKPVVVTLHFE